MWPRSPIRETFRQAGINAVDHVKDLFRMSHQLHAGTGEQKAKIIHDLITQFRPDTAVLTHLANGGQVQHSQAVSYFRLPLSIQVLHLTAAPVSIPSLC